MTTNVPREWLGLQYLDPERTLINMRHIESTMPLNKLPYKVAALRTNELREPREARQGALFTFGLGQSLGVPISFALSEKQDYDIVVRYTVNGTVTYLPVQLKEWVPETLNPRSTLQDELDKLAAKYVDSKDLAVAFYLNRDTTFDLSTLKLPIGSIGGLWLYGAANPLGTAWFLIGNLLIPNADKHEFMYPMTYGCGVAKPITTHSLS
jgi:hypothetical protein